MPALHAYNAGIMKNKTIQYTIRDIPPRVDKRLRERSASYGSSLNQVAVLALSQAVGLDEQPHEFHDLDDLAGTWVHDADFDAAMKAQDRIDKEMWQ